MTSRKKDYTLTTKQPSLKAIILLLIFNLIFTLSNAKHGESIVIGLAASSNSKDPQVKNTEPTDSIKVTNCIIQLG